MDTSAERSSMGVFAAAAAFLVPVAFTPVVTAPQWTPKVALGLLIAAVGVPALVRQAVESRASAPQFGVAFLAVAALSTLASGQPALSAFGLYSRGTGLFFLASVLGAWAIGRQLTPADRERVALALALGCLLSAVVGVVQVLAPSGISGLELFDARATGLTGNPAQFGAVCAATLALVSARVTTGANAWAAAVVLAAAGVQVSGSRFALVVAVVVVGGSAIGTRKPAAAAVLIGAAVIGLGLGTVAVGVGASGDQSGVSRLSAGFEDGGIAARLGTWKSSVHAVADRPVLGSGPGRFRVASSRYRTVSIAKAEGPERLFADAHNLVIELATTVGIVGLLLALAWIAAAASEATLTPTVRFAAVIVVVSMIEPLAVAVTPLAGLALGAGATRTWAMPRRRAPVFVAATALLAVAALVTGARLLVGAGRMQTAGLDFSRPAIDSAIRLLPPWSEPRRIKARIEAFASRPDALDRAHREYLRAARVDPTDPAIWNIAGYTSLRLGHTAEARREFLEALRWNPWSADAMDGLARVATATDDDDAARHWRDRRRQVRPDPRREERAGSRPPSRTAS